MPKILHLALFLLLPLAAHAQPALGSGDSPIDITSSKLTVRQKQGLATFSGNVRATQGEVTLTADKLDITFTHNIDKLTATGNVRFTRSISGTPETATGRTAVYTPSNRRLVMSGGVTLTRAGNTLNGETLTYDIGTGQINLGGNGRVTGRFEGKK